MSSMVDLTLFMQEEAVDGRRRLTDNQEALQAELRNSGVEPPYSHAHVSETAIHREILRIYQNARPETKIIYNLGRDTERVEEENWVIRWMLWHVFRYRDNRNRSRREKAGGSSGENDDDETESENRSTTGTSSISRSQSIIPSFDDQRSIVDGVLTQIHPLATGTLSGISDAV